MEKPLLLLDVDGVLCPFGCSTPPEGYSRNPGNPWVWYSAENGRRLRELEDRFDIVWATMWEHDANDVIAPLHGLGQYPVIMFSTRPMDWGDAGDLEFNTYKLPSVMEFIGDRPFAWVDDHLWEDAFYWAEQRDKEIPSLLIRPQPYEGITEDTFEQLTEFAKRFTA